MNKGVTSNLSRKSFLSLVTKNIAQDGVAEFKKIRIKEFRVHTNAICHRQNEM
jgi:hypothetical protein